MFVEIIDDKASFEIVKSSALLIIDECLNMNWFMSPGGRQRKNRALAKGLQRVPSAQRYLIPDNG